MDAGRMAEEPSSMVHTALQEAPGQPLAAVRQQLSAQLSRELLTALESAVAEAARNSQIAAAQAFSAAARRFRRASSVSEVGTVLLESARPYCGRAAVLVRQGPDLIGWRGVGFAPGADEITGSWAHLQIPLAEAPAFAEAIEYRKVVVAKLEAGWISAGLVNRVGAAPDERAYLIPISLHQKAVAILYADAVGAQSRLQLAALELLCVVAEASIEALGRRPTHIPGGVNAQHPASNHRSYVPKATLQAPPASCKSLSTENSDVHAHAQGVARILVSDLLLYHTEQVRRGREAKNLYGYLKQEIDKSREVYRRKFEQLVEAGVDYLHLELLRKLAANRPEVLGREYPGPLTPPLT